MLCAHYHTHSYTRVHPHVQAFYLQHDVVELARATERSEMMMMRGGSGGGGGGDVLSAGLYSFSRCAKQALQSATLFPFSKRVSCLAVHTHNPTYTSLLARSLVRAVAVARFLARSLAMAGSGGGRVSDTERAAQRQLPGERVR